MSSCVPGDCSDTRYYKNGKKSIKSYVRLNLHFITLRIAESSFPKHFFDPSIRTLRMIEAV